MTDPTRSYVPDASYACHMHWGVVAGGRRDVSFDDPKSPRMIVQEPDLTLSTFLLGGVKFPSGDTSRHTVQIPPPG